MAEPKPLSKIPRKGVLYLVLCLILIILFVFGAIIPTNNWSKELDVKIADARFRLLEQQTLLPLFQYLKAESEKKLGETLPMPAKGSLARAKINTIPGNFAISAKRSGMSLISAKPDLTGLTGDFQNLPVDIVLKGRFVDFRKFLIQLGGMPYIHRIEDISILGIPTTEEFRLRVWVAIG